MDTHTNTRVPKAQKKVEFIIELVVNELAKLGLSGLSLFFSVLLSETLEKYKIESYIVNGFKIVSEGKFALRHYWIRVDEIDYDISELVEAKLGIDNPDLEVILASNLDSFPEAERIDCDTDEERVTLQLMEEGYKSYVESTDKDKNTIWWKNIPAELILVRDKILKSCAEAPLKF